MPVDTTHPIDKPTADSTKITRCCDCNQTFDTCFENNPFNNLPWIPMKWFLAYLLLHFLMNFKKITWAGKKSTHRNADAVQTHFIFFGNGSIIRTFKTSA